jgi:fructose-bisphosphate aldolase class II
MPLATPGQYARMLDAAAKRRYAYAAINVTSSETLNAALRGFQLANADGIIQISVGAGEYMSGTGANDALLGARALARYAHVVAEASPGLVALHTDHCPPAHVDDWLRPLLAESGRLVALGAGPLFHSHMFDGSALPLADNMRISAELLTACAELGVVLEVECGVVGGEEDGIVGPANGREELYTTLDDLLRVAEALGVGERGRYLLAATFGNVHGTYAPGNVVLRPEILEAGQRALATAHPGARFQYVFHGSSGSSEQELADAISFGVVKVNVDTDNQYAFTRAVAAHVLDHWQGVLKVDGGIGDKRSYDPRAWGRAAEAAMAARVREACEALGSAGRSLANTDRATRRPRRGHQPAVKADELSPPTAPART